MPSQRLITRLSSSTLFIYDGAKIAQARIRLTMSQIHALFLVEGRVFSFKEVSFKHSSALLFRLRQMGLNFTDENICEGRCRWILERICVSFKQGTPVDTPRPNGDFAVNQGPYKLLHIVWFTLVNIIHLALSKNVCYFDY